MDKKSNNSGGGLAPAEELAPPALNLKRRRLVRGAASIAPVVLTLRSGSVAAASCVGAKALNATTDSEGKITLGGGGSVAAGDACVTPYQACESTKLSSGTLAGSVTTNESGALVCADPAAHNRQVAILSAASVTSLMGLSGTA